MIRVIFIVLGTLSLGLGITGIFVPGLPTTPFILLTAGLYVRSSDKLYRWLIQNKYLGKYITEFQTHKGLTVKTKLFSILLMWIMILVSIIYFIEATYLKWIIIIIGILGSLVMGYLLPTVKKTVIAEPKLTRMEGEKDTKY